MNRRTYIVTSALATFLGLGLLTGCSSSSSSTPPAPTIAATSGSNQSAAVSTAFAATLVATVTTGSTGTSGVSVTFTAPSGTASGTFASTGTATETDTTDSSGNATSTVFTANSTAGAYTVTATATGAAAPASFSLTNTAVVVGSATYVFYASGQELINGGPNYYALAGAVTIDSGGNVIAGEEDYNDAFGITSAGEPTTADTIAAGTSGLVVDGTTGLGTLTLTSSNTNTGVSGVQTFAVQFVNPNHALITQYDGSATSSGSLDLQTTGTTTPTGAFSFVMAGVDPSYSTVSFGGVFGTGSDLVDANDAGTVTLGSSLTMTLGATDAFGRGTTTNGLEYGSTPISINYYVVGPEAIRLIDVDVADSAVGSAFGQGTAAGTFSAASLPASVFGLSSSSWAAFHAAGGQFTTDGTSAVTGGIGDDNEMGTGDTTLDVAIGGTYVVGSTGYGSVTVNGGTFGDVSSLGLYVTDPLLNISDPNNTATGSSVGGGLLLDLDSFLTGSTGVVIPQTDSTAADFTGTYVAGWQDFNLFNSGCTYCEFDMVSVGTMDSTATPALSLTGSDSDPFATWDGTAEQTTGDTFTGIPVADGANAGRYTMNTGNATLTATIGTVAEPENVSIYQASGGQLIWVGTGDPTTDSDVFFGSVEQQGSLTGLPLARKGAPKTQAKTKK